MCWGGRTRLMHSPAEREIASSNLAPSLMVTSLLLLYNTLTRRKEIFKPISRNQVRMYSCGPTVYASPHIGNYRSFLFADTLRRYLEYRGFKIIHVMNITDIDDKTIRNSAKEGISIRVFIEKYENIYPIRSVSDLNQHF